LAELDRYQKAGLEKASRFIETARNCLRESDFESSVSRAYYSVFHTLSALKLDAGGQVIQYPIPSPRVSHDELRRRTVLWNQASTRLSAAGSLERGRGDFGRSLEALSSWRREADYQSGLTSPERAANSVRFAESILTVVKEALS